MLTKLREGARGESGFTLIELLVVILIIGILGAIAVPSFIGQRQKAKDAAAKEGVLSARTAMEACATGNDGSYGAPCDSATQLRSIEPTLVNVNLTNVLGWGTGYQLTVQSTISTNFDLFRDADGTFRRECHPPGQGGCPASGTW